MVVSINTEPNRSEFEQLLNNTLRSLHEEAIGKPELYLGLNGSKLEQEVVNVMSCNAKGTPFENSIELISGQKFPDIIANNFYGVEVKTTKSNHWKSTGSSVAEGTRGGGIERIFMLFGKMCQPVQFMCKPYEDCLSEVVVTHSPRYLIDMNLPEGGTFFDKINIPYDELRRQENPLKTVIGYYKKKLGKGDSVWWMDSDNEVERSANLIIRMWHNLSAQEKMEYRMKGYCLFPELVGRKSNKFNRFAMWLSIRQGIVCPNIRDLFTAGGQGAIVIDNKKYSQVPKVIMGLYDSLSLVKELLFLTSSEELSESWNCSVTDKNKFSLWVSLVCENVVDKRNRELVEEIFK